MRRDFVERLALCPVCRGAQLEVVDGGVDSANAEPSEVVLDGLLLCANPSCRRETPIVDGVPLLFRDLRAHVSARPLELLLRDDLSSIVRGVLGDCLGPDTAFDVLRRQLSIHGVGHWIDRSMDELVEQAVELAAIPSAEGEADDDADDAPVLDLGCAAGGAVAALARRTTRPVLGLELSAAAARLANSALRTGTARFPRRRIGLVFDDESIEIDFAEARRLQIDIWCADALDLPLPDASCAAVAAFNLLDCVQSPRRLLEEIARVLRPGGVAWLSTPYDWSASATPVEDWLGGHSQRGEHGGAGEPILRHWIAAQAGDALSLVGEECRVPWSVRLHERSRVEYSVDLVALRRT